MAPPIDSGGVRDARASSASAEYAELRRRLHRSGLLTRRPTDYAGRIVRNLALLGVTVGMLIDSDTLLARLLAAGFLGFVSVHLGFIFHDAGHRQIFATPGRNDIVGLVHANLLLGVSYGWWVDKHNRHHSHPNQVDLDPDIEIPLIAFDEPQALAKRGVARVIARYQAFLLYPLLCFEGLHLRIRSAQFLLHQGGKHRSAEAVLLLLNAALYLALLRCIGDLAVAALVFLVHHAMTGIYLGSVFAPNHKGMLVVDRDSPLDFLRRQVLTSRNVRAHPVTDFLYGGLNYQIEHHLFPSLPRGHLRAAQPIVRAFCAERSIPYVEVGPLAAEIEILRYLHRVGAPLRNRSLVGVSA